MIGTGQAVELMISESTVMLLHRNALLRLSLLHVICPSILGEITWNLLWHITLCSHVTIVQVSGPETMRTLYRTVMNEVNESHVSLYGEKVLVLHVCTWLSGMVHCVEYCFYFWSISYTLGCTQYFR